MDNRPGSLTGLVTSYSSDGSRGYYVVHTRVNRARSIFSTFQQVVTHQVRRLIFPSENDYPYSDSDCAICVCVCTRKKRVSGVEYFIDTLRKTRKIVGRCFCFEL